LMYSVGEILVGPGDGDGSPPVDKCDRPRRTFGRCKPERLRFAPSRLSVFRNLGPSVARTARMRELTKRRRWLAQSGSSRPSRGYAAFVDPQGWVEGSAASEAIGENRLRPRMRAIVSGPAALDEMAQHTDRAGDEFGARPTVRRLSAIERSAACRRGRKTGKCLEGKHERERMKAQGGERREEQGKGGTMTAVSVGDRGRDAKCADRRET